jgi:hypothetical protein
MGGQWPQLRGGWVDARQESHEDYGLMGKRRMKGYGPDNSLPASKRSELRYHDGQGPSIGLTCEPGVKSRMGDGAGVWGRQHPQTNDQG